MSLYGYNYEMVRKSMLAISVAITPEYHNGHPPKR